MKPPARVPKRDPSLSSRDTRRPRTPGGILGGLVAPLTALVLSGCAAPDEAPAEAEAVPGGGRTPLEPVGQR